MAVHTPTEEQQVVLAEAKSKDNLLISALAGAAKTTTLTWLASKTPVVSTLSVQFNKRIADEMARRMPSHVTCSTLNSVGHRAWGNSLGKKMVVASDKGYDILQSMMGGVRPEEKKEFGEMFSSILRGFRMAKALGYVPGKFVEFTQDKASLISWDELAEELSQHIDYDPDDRLFSDRLNFMLEQSIGYAYEGRIDFDDQLYMSTLFNGKFSTFDLVFVDEAQDLSPLNHKMLRKLVGKRIIAVGDENQAIYGFRGAAHDSMELLREEFSMKELTLSTTFRCPKAVVERAKRRVPHMQAAPWAEDGLVENHGTEWEPSLIPDGAAVICRNNAPLFSCALRLIKAGRSVQIVGSDIGKTLITMMEKMNVGGNLKRAEFHSLITEWQTAQLDGARESRKAAINDRAECLRAFADVGQTMSESIAYAQRLFNAKGRVLFLTGHKSKGEEFDVVFHLNPWMIPSKFALRAAEEGDDRQLQQELNLRYVIETRSKKELHLLSLPDHDKEVHFHPAEQAGLLEDLSLEGDLS